jgi:hypothetical protein
MSQHRSAILFGLVLATGLLFTACARSAQPTGHTLLPGAQRSLGAAKTCRNLTLIPVYDSAAKATDTYMTLDEGLKAKQVKVQEAQDGGEVNTLYISNSGSKPLYLMAGEVVLGGQQDRCLARDTIIPPGKRGVHLTVFCVEHGRWTGRSEFAESAPTVASADIRANAQEGSFLADSAVASRPPEHRADAFRVPWPSARSSSATLSAPDPAQISSAQEKVWEKVEMKNERFKTATVTGTYRGVLTMSSGETQQDCQPYIQALSGSLDTDLHLVGIVAAVNGKVVAADIFGDPALFRKLWPKLLRAYVVDAAENVPDKDQKVQAATMQQAQDFLMAAHAAGSKDIHRSDGNATLRLESPSTLSYQLVPGGQDVGGFDHKALHENVLKN